MSELSTMPAYEINSFARWVAKATEIFFENSENKKRFLEWKEKRMREAMNEKGLENTKGYTLKCSHHNYVSLFYDGKFIHCYDNSCGEDKYMENVIENIEKRTRMKFDEIPIIGCVDDFNGLRFLNGGFKKDWVKNLIVDMVKKECV